MSLVITMGTKVCDKCGETKNLDSFYKRKASKDGKQPRCRECVAKYYKDNKEALNSRMRAHYKDNRESYNARMRAHYKDNKGSYNARDAKRRARKKQATPKWANLKQIEGLYKLAQYLTEEHGRQIHVDHIAPLQNPLVCGLHVQDNLQLLFADENRSKSNSFKVG
jgi:hypothetical protein